MYYLGFDIGGSSIKAVLLESPIRKDIYNGASKKIIKSAVEDLPNNLGSTLSLVEKIKNDLIAGLDASQIGGIGFGIAGCLDTKREKILRSYNIPYFDNQPIKSLLEEKLKPYPLKIEHDINCFLLAEKELGLVGGLKNVFFMTVGTGIGSAWMVDNKIQLGAHGAVGETGHEIIEAGRGPDLDELEEMASNKFIKRTLKVGSMEAYKMAQSGDEAALKTFYELGRNLGIGMANIINSFDPEAVILSGGIAEAKEFILPGISESIEKYVISPAAKKTQILFSELGRFGGALGAALMFDDA